MKLTDAQHRWLGWLHDNGGRARTHGLFVVAGDQRSGTGAAISFLNLVAKDAVRGQDGLLVITDYGCRLLNRGAPPVKASGSP